MHQQLHHFHCLVFSSGAFHDGAVIVGQEQGVLVQGGLGEFLSYCAKLRLPRRQRHDSYRVALTDKAGNMAFARVEEDLAGQKVTSYLTLMRKNGRWKVICRGFYAAGLSGLTVGLAWGKTWAEPMTQMLVG